MHEISTITITQLSFYPIFCSVFFYAVLQNFYTSNSTDNTSMYIIFPVLTGITGILHKNRQNIAFVYNKLTIIIPL